MQKQAYCMIVFRFYSPVIMLRSIDQHGNGNIVAGKIMRLEKILNCLRKRSVEICVFKDVNIIILVNESVIHNRRKTYKRNYSDNSRQQEQLPGIK